MRMTYGLMRQEWSSSPPTAVSVALTGAIIYFKERNDHRS
jgi:hypothetical protein